MLNVFDVNVNELEVLELEVDVLEELELYVTVTSLGHNLQDLGQLFFTSSSSQSTLRSTEQSSLSSQCSVDVTLEVGEEDIVDNVVWTVADVVELGHKSQSCGQYDRVIVKLQSSFWTFLHNVLSAHFVTVVEEKVMVLDDLVVDRVEELVVDVEVVVVLHTLHILGHKFFVKIDAHLEALINTHSSSSEHCSVLVVVVMEEELKLEVVDRVEVVKLETVSVAVVVDEVDKVGHNPHNLGQNVFVKAS